MTEHSLTDLQRWFPTGTAEGERDILPKVFIENDQLERIFSPPLGSPHLLVGKKGSGKSAIFEHLLNKMQSKGIPVLLIRPIDIDSSSISDSSSLGDITREFLGILLSTIANVLAKRHNGLLVGHLRVLYDEAVAAGIRSPSGIGKISRLLAAIAKPITKVDFASLFPETGQRQQIGLRSAILKEVTDSKFFLLIDDTDQVANPEKIGHLNRLWGLILAIREITSSFNTVKAVISLRTEVWERLGTESAGQRDQTDHFATLVIKLNSNPDYIAKILDRRILCAAGRDVMSQDIPYQEYFEGHTARAPQSPDSRSWRDLISVRARHRPRDAIQLINSMTNRAVKDDKLKIDEATFQTVMPEFSKTRARFFAQEVEVECPQGLSILDTFAELPPDDGGYRYKAETVRDHLLKVPTRFSISLYGRTVSVDNPFRAFTIWSFLYTSDILNARISDSKKSDGYAHLSPDDHPSLVNKANWNELQKILWEINPAYRDYLQSVQVAEADRTGLPVRRRRTRR